MTHVEKVRIAAMKAIRDMPDEPQQLSKHEIFDLLMEAKKIMSNLSRLLGEHTDDVAQLRVEVGMKNDQIRKLKNLLHNVSDVMLRCSAEAKNAAL